MAGYDINVGRDLLPGLLSGQNGLAKRVETVLNHILEAQVAETLGADRHERSEERQGYRNGYRARTLYTRVGPVTLQVPQTRDGSFSTDIFKRYQRSEQAFVLALMEMVVQVFLPARYPPSPGNYAARDSPNQRSASCVSGWMRASRCSTNAVWKANIRSSWWTRCSSKAAKVTAWSSAQP